MILLRKGCLKNGHMFPDVFVSHEVITQMFQNDTWEGGLIPTHVLIPGPFYGYKIVYSENTAGTNYAQTLQLGTRDDEWIAAQ